MRGTIGSDPEFLIYNHKERYRENAIDVLNRVYGYTAGEPDYALCDGCSSWEECQGNDYWDCHEEGGYSAYEEEIGLDGNVDVGELRPTEARDPREHFKHLHRLLQQLYRDLNVSRKMEKYCILGGSGYPDSTSGLPIGGHIHFGSFRRFKTIEEKVRHLDDLLSIPLLFVEEYPANKLRRIGTEYGLPGAYSWKSYGFEYRTPASWLIEPVIAKGVLCLAYAIVFQEKKLEVPKILSEGYEESYLNGEIEEFRPFLKPIVSTIKRLDLYRHFRTEIDPLLERVARNYTWNEKSNVWHNWGIARIPGIVGSMSQKSRKKTGD